MRGYIFVTRKCFSTMKTLFSISFALLALLSLSAQTNYEKADSVAKTFNEDYADATDLALKLTKPFCTEAEKARVIFAWVAMNIRYDYKKYKDPPPKPHFSGSTRKEVEKKVQEWQENEIRKTLRSKKGVCADYSRLYQKMCESAGLESVVVTGLSRKLTGRGDDHAWNAVKISGQWHLLDATWGAGFVDDEDEHFVRRYMPAFFGTPPALFILHHLPNEDKWQLLEKPISKKEFDKQPKVNFSNPDCPLLAFSPENGKINVKDGKAEVRFKFESMPAFFGVLAGKNRQMLPQVQKTDDGWATLTFSPGKASTVSVFAGKNEQKATMLAQFSVE